MGCEQMLCPYLPLKFNYKTESQIRRVAGQEFKEPVVLFKATKNAVNMVMFKIRIKTTYQGMSSVYNFFACLSKL